MVYNGMDKKKSSALVLVTRTIPRLDIMWAYLAALEQTGMTWGDN